MRAVTARQPKGHVATNDVHRIEVAFRGVFGALILALILGSLLGVLRTTPNKWLSRLGNAYVELFRNVPLVIQ